MVAVVCVVRCVVVCVVVCRSVFVGADGCSLCVVCCVLCVVCLVCRRVFFEWVLLFYAETCCVCLLLMRVLVVMCVDCCVLVLVAVRRWVLVRGGVRCRRGCVLFADVVH